MQDLLTKFRALPWQLQAFWIAAGLIVIAGCVQAVV